MQSSRKRKSENDDSEMDRTMSATICNDCQRAGHIARFCPIQICEGCSDPGHAKRDCPRQHELREFILWLPIETAARMGISDHHAPLREVRNIGANLQLMRHAGPTMMNGHRFSVEYNALRLNYSGRGTIVIALQDAGTDAETLIHVRTVRQENANQAKIKIAAKFTVMAGALTEDTDRLASGSRQQRSPEAETHVLIHIPGMLSATAALDINGKKYYIEWGSHVVDRHLRAEVQVYTHHARQHRLVNRNRAIIDDMSAYFRGIPRGNNAAVPAIARVMEIAPDAAALPRPAPNLMANPVERERIPAREIAAENEDPIREETEPAENQQIVLYDPTLARLRDHQHGALPDLNEPMHESSTDEEDNVLRINELLDQRD